MKNLMVIIIAGLMLYSCGSTTSKKTVHSLVGEWDAHLNYEGKPYVFLARFKANGSYNGFMDGKNFVSGTYRTAGDSLYITDGLCNMAYEGLYKLTYYGDSLRFDVLTDTCRQRVEGSSGLAVKRIAGK